MADKPADKARSKAALEMILAWHVKKGGSVIEAELQATANDPTVLGQLLVSDCWA